MDSEAVLSASLEKAAAAAPMHETVHSSQINAANIDVADDGVIPEWRLKELEMKTGELRVSDSGRFLATSLRFPSSFWERCGCSVAHNTPTPLHQSAVWTDRSWFAGRAAGCGEQNEEEALRKKRKV
jgi:hypothetical protein